MPRYVARLTRSEADCDYDASLYDRADRVSIEVHERNDRPTGLLDQDGNEIWCVRDPIGFRIGD